MGLAVVEGAGRFEPAAFGLVGEGRTSDDDLAGCSSGALFCGCCSTLFAEPWWSLAAMVNDDGGGGDKDDDLPWPCC